MFFKRDKPIIRQRAEHCISRTDIDKDALKVLYRLSEAGYTAYLVGGGVRDLLLGRKPKDFDVGTDARPNEIKRLFRNCFLIGRRFRLAQIRWGQNIIETSTFRKTPPPPEDPIDTLYQRDDNTFGTPQEDALRRDFTVNGLFYDIKTFEVIDYVGGLRDLEKRVIRCIGDPNIRFREDPVRMMRAVRFAAVLGFKIDWLSRFAIRRHYRELEKAPVPRLQEEVLRLFSRHASASAFRLLHDLKMMSLLVPDVDAYIGASGGGDSPLWKILAAFDADPASDDASNALRLAVLYYPLFRERLAEASASRRRVNRNALARELMAGIAERLRLPRAAYFGAAAILDSQRRFESPDNIRPGTFRAELFDDALAFFRIRLASEGLDTSPADRIARRFAQALADQQPLYSEDVAAFRDADAPDSPDEAAADEQAEQARGPESDESNSERPFGRRHRRRGGRRHRNSNRGRRNLPNPEVSGSPFADGKTDNGGSADGAAPSKEQQQ